MERDLISIIMPVHNSERYVKDAISSILNQTYSNWELIIVDDASVDSSLHIVEGIKDKRIKVIKSQKQLGSPLARNKALKYVNGKYVCFLDSDDLWDKDKLKKQLKFIKDNNYDFVYTKYYYLRENGSSKKAHIPTKLDYIGNLKNTAISLGTVMVKLDKIKLKDLEMENYKTCHDAVTWWKILKKGFTAYGMNYYSLYYRVGHPSLTHNKLLSLYHTWAGYRDLDLPFFKKVYYYLMHIIHAIIRRI